ncbi:MAG: hypothetical protein RL238_807 [Actinomycetota bacterium]
MQRNTLFGGLALLMAGGVIGAGAMISSSAMADEGGTPPANEVTMINVGSDGEAVQCTFSGADAEGLFPEMPSIGMDVAIPAENVATPVEGVVGGSGVIEIEAGSLPEGVEIGEAIAVGDISGSALPTDLPDGVQVLSADDARDGTPEECAAMREQAASGQPAEGSMVIGSAVAEALPTQP